MALINNHISAGFVKYLSLAKAAFSKKRIFNLTKILYSCVTRRSEVAGMPFLVQVEPTNRCALKCKMCIKGAGILSRKDGDLDLEGFKKIIRELEGSMVYLSLYNLGEPLLNKEIFEMIKYAKSKSIFVRLSTNGELLDEENIVRLINSGLDDLVISLDCVNQQDYVSYKGVDNFEKVINNVSLLIRERKNRPKPFISLQVLAMKNISKDIIDFRNLAKSLKVDKALVKKLRVNFPGLAPEKNLLPESDTYIRDFYKGDFKRKFCIRPLISAVFLWDGSVIPCCFDMQGQYSFGNIYRERFKDTWNSSSYAFFRKNAAENPNQISICKECSLDGILEYLANYS